MRTPESIEVANRVFAPTAREIEQAQAIVEAVARAEANGEGTANLDGMMIDAATTRLFEVTLERAGQCAFIG